MTDNQLRTIEVLQPPDCTSTHIESELEDGSLVVAYRSDFGPYSEVIARYLIEPGAGFLRLDCVTPLASRRAD